MRGPEAQEKDAIRKYLRGGGAGNPMIWFFSPYMAGFGAGGVPDIVGCYKFKGLFAIEVKREGKEPTPIQYRRMAEVEAAGGKAFWGASAKVISEFEDWIA
jgi:hypothetical protein